MIDPEIYESRIKEIEREIDTNNSNIYEEVELIPTTDSVNKIVFNNLEIINDSLNFGLKDINEEDSVQSYAIDPTKANFTNATVSVTAKGTVLYKCQEWNYDLEICNGDWKLLKTNLIPGKEYTFTLTSTDPGFKEIFISKANHLDQNKILIEDIYALVSNKDDIWKTIPENNYIRITFEQKLSKLNDITIYAKSNSSATLEIYEFNTTNLIATIPNIKNESYYKTYLTNLNQSQDTFDLKVVGSNITFDYIVDPIEMNISINVSNNPVPRSYNLHVFGTLNLSNGTNISNNEIEVWLNGTQMDLDKYVFFDNVSTYTTVSGTINTCRSHGEYPNINCIVTTSGTASSTTYNFKSLTISSGRTITVSANSGCGGAGGKGGKRADPFVGYGGSGGGCFSVKAKKIINLGTITAPGNNGASDGDNGCGGGGAGGTIVLIGEEIKTGTLTAKGGNGGNGWGKGGGGGGGAGGTIKVYGSVVNFTGSITAYGGSGGNNANNHAGASGQGSYGRGGQGGWADFSGSGAVGGYYGGGGGGGRAYNMGGGGLGTVGSNSATTRYLQFMGMSAGSGSVATSSSGTSRVFSNSKSTSGASKTTYNFGIQILDYSYSPQNGVSVTFYNSSNDAVLSASTGSDGYVATSSLSLSDDNSYTIKTDNSDGFIRFFSFGNSQNSATSMVLNRTSNNILSIGKVYLDLSNSSGGPIVGSTHYIKTLNSIACTLITNASGQAFCWLPKFTVNNDSSNNKEFLYVINDSLIETNYFGVSNYLTTVGSSTLYSGTAIYHNPARLAYTNQNGFYNISFSAPSTSGDYELKVNSSFNSSNGTLFYAENNLTLTVLPPNAPIINSITINSSTIFNTTQNHLTCYGDFTDLDNATIDVNYKIYKNNILNLSGTLNSISTGSIQNLLTISNTSIQKGELWNCSIQGTDGEFNSTSFENDSILIRNTAPSLTAPLLNNTNPEVTTTISCTGGIFSDLDLDSENTREYRWYNGSNLLAGQTSNMLDLSVANIIEGNILKCSIRADDGSDFSSWINSSNNASIPNSIPSVSAPTLNSTTPYTNDSLSCAGGVFSDSDILDFETSREFKWFDGATEIAGQTSSTLNLNISGLDKNDLINCSIRVSDGTNFSSWINSSNVATITNAPPNVTAPILNITSVFNDRKLNCTGGNFTDLDYDSENSREYKWFNNSIEISGETSNIIDLTGKGIIPNSNMTCSVRVNDGADNSDWINSSNTANIANRIPFISLSEPNGVNDLNYTEDFNVTWIVTELDNEPINVSCYADNDTSGYDALYTAFTNQADDSSENISVSSWAQGFYTIWCIANDRFASSPNAYSPSMLQVNHAPKTFTSGDNSTTTINDYLSVSFNGTWNDTSDSVGYFVSYTANDPNCRYNSTSNCLCFDANETDGTGNCTYSNLVGQNGTKTWYSFACDDQNRCSNQISDTFDINRQPSIGQPSISASYKTNDTMTCSVGTFTDIDSDSENIGNRVFAWYNNGSLISGETSSTLDLTLPNLNKNHNITCSWRTSDEHNYFSNVSMVSLNNTIKNTVPNVTAPLLNNTSPELGDILNCTGGTFFDYYDINDTEISREFIWYNGSSIIVGQNNQTLNLTSDLANKHNKINCSVRVYDGENWSLWVNSSNFATVANKPPAITVNEPDGVNDLNFTGNFNITWTANDLDNDTLNITCYADSNNLGYAKTYLLFANETDDSSENISVSSWAQGNYYVWCYANDGIINSSSDYSPNMLQVNHAPKTFTSGDNSTTTINDYLSVSFNGTWNDTSDSVGYFVSYTANDPNCRYNSTSNCLCFDANETDGTGNCTYSNLIGQNGTKTWYSFACDDQNRCSNQISDTFDINRQPSIGQPSIMGATHTNSIFMCGPGAFSDIDSDSENASNREYLWYKNNVLISGLNNASIYLSSPGFDKGDYFNCSLRTSDEHGYYSNYSINSTRATITNSVPVVNSILLQTINDTNLTSQNLKCYINLTDIDSENLTINYSFYKDSVIHINGSTSMSSLELGTLKNIANISYTNTSGLENWYCSAIINDSENKTLLENSTTLTVIDPLHITSCRELNDSIHYIFTQNITGSNDCFNITGNNLSIDCRGHVITGVEVNSSLINSIGRRNIIIKNCIFENITEVINIDSNNNFSLNNLTLINITNGINLKDSQNINISNSTFRNVSTGIIQNSTNDLLIKNTSIIGNTINSTLIDSITATDMYELSDISLKGTNCDLNLSNSSNNNYSLGLLNNYCYVSSPNIGRIEFTNHLIASNITLGIDLNISSNFIYLNSTKVNQSSAANITLYNTGTGSLGNMLRNESICNSTTIPSCFNYSNLNENNVTFNVSSFSNYSINKFKIDLLSPVESFSTTSRTNTHTFKVHFAKDNNVSSCLVRVGNTSTSIPIAGILDKELVTANTYSEYGAHSWYVSCIDGTNTTSTTSIARSIIITQPASSSGSGGGGSGGGGGGSSGGGGGSGGFGGFAPQSKPLDFMLHINGKLVDSFIPEGSTVRLNLSNKTINYELYLNLTNNEDHTIYATIGFPPRIVNIKTGLLDKIDLDLDGVYDLELTLVKTYESKKALMSFREINEKYILGYDFSKDENNELGAPIIESPKNNEFKDEISSAKETISFRNIVLVGLLGLLIFILTFSLGAAYFYYKSN